MRYFILNLQNIIKALSLLRKVAFKRARMWCLQVGLLEYEKNYNQDYFAKF